LPSSKPSWEGLAKKRKGIKKEAITEGVCGEGNAIGGGNAVKAEQGNVLGRLIKTGRGGLVLADRGKERPVWKKKVHKRRGESEKPPREKMPSVSKELADVEREKKFCAEGVSLRRKRLPWGEEGKTSLGVNPPPRKGKSGVFKVGVEQGRESQRKERNYI